MPEHASWLTFLLALARKSLDRKAEVIGESFIDHTPPSWASFEPITAALFVVALVLVLAWLARRRLKRLDEAVIPESRLTIGTFMEIFLGYFYDLARGMMGPERAKRYFPIIGTSAMFVFFANVMAMIPGMPVATSHLSITFGCALVVFVVFNAYGLMTNGMAYLKHLGGPSWYLAPLVFVIEFISLCVRPLTLAIRLMLNMAVDHLIVVIFLSLLAVVLPISMMVIECLVVVIQTLVFTVLTTIYISLATEPLHH